MARRLVSGTRPDSQRATPEKTEVKKMSLTKMKDITRTGALTICIVVALMGVRFEKVQPRILASGIAEQAQLSVADSTLEEAQFSRRLHRTAGRG
jgi:hypothetical protein